MTADPPPRENGRRVTLGGLAALAGQLTQFAVGVATFVLLARFLSPAEFGLFAMAAVPLRFVETFRDFGLPLAVTQAADLSAGELATLRRWNLRANLLLTAGLLVAAPFVGAFFGSGMVGLLAAASAIAVPAAGSGNVDLGLLRRRLRFVTLAGVELAGVLAGATSAIAAAAGGAGAWALVVQAVVTAVVGAVGLKLAARPVAASDDRPTDDGIDRFLSYGRGVTLSRVAEQAGRLVDRAAVGKAFGAAEVGLYDAAYRWSMTPSWQIHRPLTGVAVAALSRTVDDADRYRATFRGFATALYAAIVPLALFVAVAADDLVVGLLGAEWTGAVTPLRVLSLATLLGTPARTAKWAYLSEGRTDRQARWSLGSAGFLSLATLAGLPWGPDGVASGVAAGIGLSAIPAVLVCVTGSRLRTADFVRPLGVPLLAGSAATAVTVGGDGLFDVMPLFEAIVAAATFGLSYAAAFVAPRAGRGLVRDLVRLARGGDA